MNPIDGAASSCVNLRIATSLILANRTLFPVVNKRSVSAHAKD